MDRWVQEGAEEIARRAVRHLEALVAVSSPSGDVHGAEECASVCAALLPDEAEVERIPCSSEGYAPDLLARLRGHRHAAGSCCSATSTPSSPTTSTARCTREGEKLVGSGSVDMKGGVVLSLGAHAPARQAPAGLRRGRAAGGHATRSGARARSRTSSRFAGWDACLCFEGGERTPDGDDAVVVRRKAAGTIQVRAHGRAAHSGSAPDRGRNALLALGVGRARGGRAATTRTAPAHLTAVPTVLRSGDAFNVVPGSGELFCDLRADEIDAIEAVLDAIPAEHEGVRLESELIRRWPGMHSEERGGRPAGAARRPRSGARRAAPRAAGRATRATSRPPIPVTVDGLGPRGGAAHNPDEFVLEASLASRAEVALALVAARCRLGARGWRATRARAGAAARPARRPPRPPARRRSRPS